jgi:riboflavin synthase
VFTGIVHDIYPVSSLVQGKQSSRLGIILADELIKNLTLGASIAVDGVCLTVSAIKNNHVFFDIIVETLTVSTLSQLKLKQLVNIERAAKFGDDIGGHILSGHVIGTATIKAIDVTPENKKVTLQVDPKHMKYIIEKGYVALDGASLTLCYPNYDEHTFAVYLIPETCKRTTFSYKKVGDRVNLEIDSQTQTIIDTLMRLNVARQT